MLPSIIYAHVLVYRRVVKYVAKHVLVYRRVVKYVAKHYICTCASVQESSKCTGLIPLLNGVIQLLKYNFNITAKIT